MSATAYRILGYAVWRGGKWYLRQRVRTARRIALSTVGAGLALGAAAMIVRRRAG
jgi:hypothetical protein